MQWLSAIFAFLFAFGAFFGASFLTAAWRRRRRTEGEVLRLERALPGYDCGLCGRVDCRDYASALASEGADPARCAPGGSATESALRAILGESPQDGRGAQRRAVVRCAGTAGLAQTRYEYDGYADCASAALLYGGPKRCKDGCLGFGSCVRACPLDAIRVEEGCALIDPELCTGCGLCLPLCPTGVIELLPASQLWHVACSAASAPEGRLRHCAAACTACEECARRSFQGEFTLVGNIARASAGSASFSAEIAESCPTGAILRVGDRKKR